MNMQETPVILLVVPDLLARSRLEEAVKAEGVEVAVARRLHDPGAPSAIVVDLDRMGALDEIEAWEDRPDGVVLVGFVSHVDVETRSRAEALGFEVVTRGTSAARVKALARALVAAR